MTPKKASRLSNKLEIYRKRKSFTLKKVASMIGRQTTFQLSRYETGREVPSLKTALKLAIIYKIPIEVLLDGYFEACRDEIRLEDKTGQGIADLKERQLEFCTFEERLDNARFDQNTLDQAGHHIAQLINKRAAKSEHF